ncbi:MAG: zinc-binding dehydrogenase [Lachnospiraceae bacterium]
MKALTDGYGCDIYIEATGNPASVRQGLTVIRKLGTFVEFSVFGSETTVDWSIIGDRKELDIRGSHLSPYAYPFVIENMMKGNIKTNGVVSRIFRAWRTGRRPLNMLPENMVTSRLHLHLTNFYAYMACRRCPLLWAASVFTRVLQYLIVKQTAVFLMQLTEILTAAFFSDIPSASFDNAF